MNLNELTIRQALEGLRKREFSSTEVVASCLRKIKSFNSRLNAFLTVCEKEALSQALLADKKIKDKVLFQKYPLLGIPIAIKDNFCTRGIRTTAGSKVLADYIPEYDSTVVTKLKSAGAIIIGKTNLDAWAHGSSGENSDFGPTKNPWNLNFVPGGSSSGSAAALASDMALAATGTDTAGSIRFPASFCNLVGLKPTYGRVSRHGIIAMGSSLDSIGHLTKNVIDSALLLSVTAGKDPYDATTPPIAVENYGKQLSGLKKRLKLGIPREYFGAGIEKEVKNRVEEAIKVFERLGLVIQEVSLPHSQYAIAVYYIIMPSEVSSNLARYDSIRYGFSRNTFGKEAKRRIMLGTYALSAGYYDAYYLQAMKVRTLIKTDFENVFKKVDALLTPVSPTLPFRLGEKVNDPLKMYLCDIYTATVNLAGVPALALPAGFVYDLPVGIQIIGPQFSESLLFKIGFNYEQATNWNKFKPKL